MMPNTAHSSRMACLSKISAAVTEDEDCSLETGAMKDEALSISRSGLSLLPFWMGLIGVDICRRFCSTGALLQGITLLISVFARVRMEWCER